MSTIETLTDEERADLEELPSCQAMHVESHQANERRAAALQKALRIIDAQAALITELEAELATRQLPIPVQVTLLLPDQVELEEQIQEIFLKTLRIGPEKLLQSRLAEMKSRCDSAENNLYGAEQTRAKMSEQIKNLKARIAELEKQLPEEMQHCAIKFIECPVGHGRLTATNWVDNGCHWCRIAELETTRTLPMQVAILTPSAQELQKQIEQACLAVFGDHCTPAERKVLDAIETTLRRLGDDPPYYEVEPGDLMETPIAEAIAAWLGSAPPGGFR